MIVDFHGDLRHSGSSGGSKPHARKRYLRYVIDRARHASRDISRHSGKSRIPSRHIQGADVGDGWKCSHWEQTWISDGQVARLAQRARLRRSFGIPAKTVVVFTGGQLVTLEANRNPIEAIKHLSPEQVHLVVSAEAPSEPETKRLHDERTYRDGTEGGQERQATIDTTSARRGEARVELKTIWRATNRKKKPLMGESN